LQLIFPSSNLTGSSKVHPPSSTHSNSLYFQSKSIYGFWMDITNIETPRLLIKSQGDRNLSLIFGVVAVFLFLEGLQYINAVYAGVDQEQFWIGFVIAVIFFLAGAFSLGFAVREHFKAKQAEKEIVLRKDEYAISFLNKKRVIRSKEGIWGYGIIAALFVIAGILILLMPKFAGVGFSFLILGVVTAFVSLYYVLALRNLAPPIR
jgi:hypothetical protein